MIIIEVIIHFIVEVIFINIIGGAISRINNFILKLRGIETKSLSEIKLEKLRNRYEYNTVKLLKDLDEKNGRGSIGIVVELIDEEEALVEFNDDNFATKVKLKDLRKINSKKS